MSQHKIVIKQLIQRNRALEAVKKQSVKFSINSLLISGILLAECLILLISCIKRAKLSTKFENSEN